MSQPPEEGRTRSQEAPLEALRTGIDLAVLTHRPAPRVSRNQVDEQPRETGSLLRAGHVDAPEAVGTVHSMTEEMTPASYLRPLLDRPVNTKRPTAKTISQVRPEVVVPRAADPAVLVDLHSDLRLSLCRLAHETGISLAGHYSLAAVATGCISLAPTIDDTAARKLTLRVDTRGRLRLTQGVVHRLAVAVGEKVLVTVQPETQTLRLLNLGTLADAVESRLVESEAITS